MQVKSILIATFIFLIIVLGLLNLSTKLPQSPSNQDQTPETTQPEPLISFIDTPQTTQSQGTEFDQTKDYQAIFNTNLGNFKLDLFEKQSPVTVGNFVKLAKSGFYDGQRFHRVIDGFMIQSGDPYSKSVENKALWGTGGPGYVIYDEYIEGLSNVRGTIAMANKGAPQTGGSQFFINIVDNTYLDWDKEPLQSRHPVFGKVIEGMDIVDAISKVATDQGSAPLEDVIITKLEVIEL